MMMSPDLLNVVMMRWITYIQLFTFEVNHTPGVAHRIPNGLSCQLHAADNSDYSDGEIDVEDGIKLVRALPVEVNSIDYEETKVENNVHVCKALSQLKLECVPGEVKALECKWDSSQSLLHDYQQMYAGVGKEIGLEEESDWLNHEHHIPDRDSEDYWEQYSVLPPLKAVAQLVSGS